MYLISPRAPKMTSPRSMDWLMVFLISEHCIIWLPQQILLYFLQQALQEAQEDLEETQKILDEAKARLSEVEEGITTLQAKYRDCVSKKEELEQKCDQCEQRLGRADKVIRDKPQTFTPSLVSIFTQLSSVV